MKNSADDETEEKRGRGRPRKYATGAERVAAFRANAKYPGHRYDLYLGETAHVIVYQLMRETGLSASKVVDGVLAGVIQLPAK